MSSPQPINPQPIIPPTQNQQESQADQFFNNIATNPLASAGLSVAQNYLNQGDQLLKSQLGGIFSFDAWRYYFNVNTSFVLKKILMIIMPYPFLGTWERKYVIGEDQSKLYNVPQEDIYAPDLYIPLMGFISYVLAIGFYYGSKGTFTPETLSMTTTLCLILISLEVMILKFLEYMLFNYSSDFRIYLSYVSYVFVPVLMCTFVGSLQIPYLTYIALLFFGTSYAFFLYKTLFGSLASIQTEENKKRIYSICVGVFQIILIFFMMK
ncbi:protein YIF1A, putative [Entamoeba histolytica HM-3:IMSS]|uniref:Protein YIF1 n=1 Tax=Entamoeba histolytica HM-3:IMSS TaxID=885315 RepID=M7WAN3_ENTHI|nr:protein YIF1A, putative [Entamoeba histolytica HM-3:IMSS]